MKLTHKEAVNRERDIQDELERLKNKKDKTPEDMAAVQPLLDEPGPVHSYEPGTWGPAKASELTRGIAQWSQPWLPEAPSEVVLGF